MKRLLIFTAVILGSLATAARAEIKIEIENFQSRSGIYTVTFKVTNDGPEAFDRLTVACTFLDAEKKAIDIGLAIVRGLSVGATQYDQAAIVEPNRTPEFVTCQGR